MTAAEGLYQRVRELVQHMMDHSDRYISSTTSRRALSSGNVSVRTLARIADTLGFRVVIQVVKK